MFWVPSLYTFHAASMASWIGSFRLLHPQYRYHDIIVEDELSKIVFWLAAFLPLVKVVIDLYVKAYWSCTNQHQCSLMSDFQLFNSKRQSDKPWALLDYVATLLFLLLVLGESVADAQMFALSKREISTKAAKAGTLGQKSLWLLEVPVKKNPSERYPWFHTQDGRINELQYRRTPY